MDYAELQALAALHHLDILGGFHPGPDDKVPEGNGTLLLLGPLEPGFWAYLTASPEWQDGKPDPIDRWSTRVVGALSRDIGGVPLFPFGGPPWHPFIAWALRSGRAWQSPVSILVHDVAGLMVSYRGAIAVPDRLSLPEPRQAPPCEDCSAPCLSACPAGALTDKGYDVPLCHAFLDTVPGSDCMDGCLVRRACPLSKSFHRDPRQSAYHMGVFHR